MSVLDIEFVPDVVNWTYRGEVFPLEIEFEDSELFAEAGVSTDMDINEGDDNAGARKDSTDEASRERPNGSGPVAQLPQTGSGVEPAPSPSVPNSTLRFGSFEPASAPPRLWSDRVKSEDAFECSLPVLDFMPAVCPAVGDCVTGHSETTLGGGGKECGASGGPFPPRDLCGLVRTVGG